jgi:hypothetical protein
MTEDYSGRFVVRFGHYTKRFRGFQLEAANLLSEVLAARVIGEYQIRVLKPELTNSSTWRVTAEWTAHVHDVALDPVIDTTIKSVEIWMVRPQNTLEVNFAVRANVNRIRTVREIGESEAQSTQVREFDLSRRINTVFWLPGEFRKAFIRAVNAANEAEHTWKIEGETPKLSRVA